MAETAELTTLHRTLDQLRSCVGELRRCYGDIPAVKRLAGDVDRIDIDAAELGALTPPATRPSQEPVLLVSDEPLDPSLWADADDEGLGGYHGSRGR